MVKIVKNPKTGRMIQKNGVTYDNLVLHGNIKDASRKKKLQSQKSDWAAKAPRTTSDRRSMKSKCGSKCFLNSKKLKYPVCNKSCTYNCKGIEAAKIRSAQYKKKSINSKAKSLYNRHCGYKSKKRSMKYKSKKRSMKYKSKKRRK